MPFEFFRPLLLSFLKRPFRSREAPQPARYRKQNSKFEGKRAPEKSTCGSCEERQTKPRVEEPIDADEAKPACRITWTRASSHRGGTGRADRFFATRLRASTNEITPSEMPLPPREPARPSPEREARRLAAARLFSRARTAPADATNPMPNAPTLAITATTPLSATIIPPRLSTYGARTRCPRPAWQRRCTEAPSPRSSRRRDRENLRSPAKTGRQGQSASR